MHYGLRWFLCFSCISISRTQPLPASRGPPNIIFTYFLSSIWLAFPPNLGVFCLPRPTLLASGFVFAYGLVTPLGIAVCCNIVIRLKSVHCVLIACSVKYVRLLATTLGIVVHCNTTVTKSVYYALMTRAQLFVCYLATTISIVIRCDTAISPESIHCVLAVIKLFPICHIRFR